SGVRLPSACRSNAPIVLVPAVLSLTYTCPATGDEPVEAAAAAGIATAAAAAAAITSDALRRAVIGFCREAPERLRNFVSVAFMVASPHQLSAFARSVVLWVRPLSHRQERRWCQSAGS